MALILALGCLRASAGELGLILNGKALHYDVPAGHNYNEENWGAGLHYEIGDSRADWVPFAHGSGFLDSNDNASYYAGGGILRRFSRQAGNTELRLDMGLIGFLMYRKEFRNGDLFPGALPFISVGTPALALNISYIPKVDPKMSPLFFLQLKIRLAEFK